MAPGTFNVHFQGAEKLVNRLIELGKPFDFMECGRQGTTLHYIEEHLPAGPR